MSKKKKKRDKIVTDEMEPNQDEVSFDEIPEEKCILTSPETTVELKELSGQIAVPTTVIDNDVFIGHDRRSERRIKRKLGV